MDNHGYLKFLLHSISWTCLQHTNLFRPARVKSAWLQSKLKNNRTKRVASLNLPKMKPSILDSSHFYIHTPIWRRSHKWDSEYLFPPLYIDLNFAFSEQSGIYYQKLSNLYTHHTQKYDGTEENFFWCWWFFFPKMIQISIYTKWV